MAIEDENLPVIEIAKSPSGEAPADVGITDSSEGAIMSTYSQKGTVQPDDVTATNEVVSTTTLPLDYQYDEKQMMANVSTAISADIEDMTENELLGDETFGYASKKMFRTVMGEDFTGTDEEATEFGINLMRRVENNLVELGDFTHTVSNMKEDDAKIALYMMDMFEAKDFTGRGFAQALGYMGLDPTTYIGLGTFGFGFAGKEAVKQGAKQGIRASLQKLAYSPVTVGAAEGGFYTGIFEHGKQVVSEAAGEGYDTGSVGLNVAIGGAAGGTAGKYLPEIFDYAGEKVAKWSAAKNFKAEVRAAADAGDADAIRVLADLELLDNHFDSDGFMRRKLDEFEQTRIGQVVTGVQRAVDDGKAIDDKVTLYHGTDVEFEEFGKVGERITSLGYAHYFTPDETTAKEYGKNIKQLQMNKSDILDLDNLSKEQREEIILKLDGAVPNEVKAGFGNTERIDITDMDDDEALKIFKQKKEDTKDLWHDRAKAQVIEDGDKTYIQWMSAGLDGASDANLKNLIQEYDQSIPKSLGYKAVKNGSEVAIYDTDFVNKNIIKSDEISKKEGVDGLIVPQDKMIKKQIEDVMTKTTRDKNFKKWFSGSKAVDDRGEPLVVYHGSPHDIKEFKVGEDELIFMTANPKYAERYTYKNDKQGGIYPLFISLKKPFDTRNPEHRKIFEDKFYRQWGQGTPLDENTGLPDWTDAGDFKEFFEENNLDFDGVLITETLEGGEQGFSYAVFNPSQVKSVNNSGAFSDDGDILNSALVVSATGAAADAATSQTEGDNNVEQ